MTEDKKQKWVCPSCKREFPRYQGQTEVRCICGVVMIPAVEKEGSSKQLEVIKD